MNFETININQDGAILTVTINRPRKLNALSIKVLTEMKILLKTIREKNEFDIKGMILTGAGDKAFIAGADIKEMSQMNPREGENFGKLGQEVTTLFEALPIPIIACVNGYALGGGCEMAMACDFIYASQQAAFGQPEVSLGLIPGFGGCVRLLRFVGAGKAKELIYSGKIVGAVEAKEIGLVNRIFKTKTEMFEAAHEVLELMFTKSPIAISICKKVINAVDGENINDGLEIEKQGFRESFESPEKIEGVAAFLEKRKPVFNQSLIPTFQKRA